MQAIRLWIVLVLIVIVEALLATNVKDVLKSTLQGIHVLIVESTVRLATLFQIRRHGDVSREEGRFPYIMWR